METATITCRACGTATREPMPENACLHLFVCPACGAQLRPKPGDCCVFCSYGDRMCPPRLAQPERTRP
ncbi:MAG TPA: GDCCVxC domain-containing (seleno)protein [Longimicrobiales bacterium]